MKRFLQLSLAALTVCAIAGATPVTSNCTLFPVTFTNGSGSATVSCPGTGVQPPGTILAGAVVNYYADYQFGSFTVDPNIVKITFTPIGPGTATFNLASTDVFVSGNASSLAVGAGSATATSGVTLANFQSGFNVQLTSTVTQGTVATSSGGVKVTYDLVSTPEPSAFALIGTGLIGLGMLRRRATRSR